MALIITSKEGVGILATQSKKSLKIQMLFSKESA